MKYSVNGEWSDIASRIALLYDPEHNYTPQYEGYNRSMRANHADAMLLGYPLQYVNVDKSTRWNNLQFYGNLMSSKSEAMMWSMHAIGQLEIQMKLAERSFKRTHAPYVRQPFYVWNESVHGVDFGSSNFLSGAGGFLQLIMYGYAGIRIDSESLTITNPLLPPRTKELNLNGMIQREDKENEIREIICSILAQE